MPWSWDIGRRVLEGHVAPISLDFGGRRNPNIFPDKTLRAYEPVAWLVDARAKRASRRLLVANGSSGLPKSYLKCLKVIWSSNEAMVTGLWYGL